MTQNSLPTVLIARRWNTYIALQVIRKKKHLGITKFPKSSFQIPSLHLSFPTTMRDRERYPTTEVPSIEEQVVHCTHSGQGQLISTISIYTSTLLVRIVITLNPRIKLILPWGNNMNNSTLPDLNLRFHMNYIL